MSLINIKDEYYKIVSQVDDIIVLKKIKKLTPNNARELNTEEIADTVVTLEDIKEYFDKSITKASKQIYHYIAMVIFGYRNKDVAITFGTEKRNVSRNVRATMIDSKKKDKAGMIARRISLWKYNKEKATI